MKRIPLPPGAVVTGNGVNGLTYIIDRVIGDGASSIVYEAHYMDSANGRHNVRMKECYPFTSDIVRSGDTLSWADETVQADDKASFLQAYHKLLHFQNTANLTNSTTHVFSVCEANGTLYSVMDLNAGMTFEIEKTKKLSDILKTGLALAKVIQKYHDNGYLHLDIKPGNILVLPETREMVVLFDVDSVTAMEDIASGKVRCVSYSKGWAAPEQMQGKLDKLCPATDIYAIGAILFQKIMDRKVENADIGVFADWDFHGTLFDKVNPKIKRLLREIFHKTLAANVRRRYQSTEELIAALEDAVRTAEQVQYIRSNCPAAKSLFLGREKELTSISEAFSNGKKCVIIQGYMGMGKSSLALQYAAEHRDEYDVICWSMVNADLIPNSMDADSQLKNSHNVLIVNGSTDRTDPHVVGLKTLLTNKTLLIIDNYDVPNLTPYIEELLSLDCKILITTRTVFRNLGTDIFSIQLQELAQNDLLYLFEKESGQKYKDTSKLFDFFESQHNLTYIIVLAAAQIRESYISLDEYLEDIYSQKHFEDILFNGHDDQLLNHYRRIIRLHLLSEEQKEALRTVFVMSYAINSETRFVDSPNGVFDRAVFKAYTGMNLNALNSLIRNRIVNEDSDGELSLHPSVKEIIRLDMNPTCQNCPHLYEKMHSLIGFVLNPGSIDPCFFVDENGCGYDGATERQNELFDIYTWLYESDPNKTRHLYNLFMILTGYDFEDQVENVLNEMDIWHLKWVNREFFVSKLYEILNNPQNAKMLFPDNVYDLNWAPCVPEYSCEDRAKYEFIRICTTLMRYISMPYYDGDYDQTFSHMIMVFGSICVNTLNAIQDHNILPKDQYTLLDDIIEKLEPIFYNCCAIDRNGDYWDIIEHALYNPIAITDVFDDMLFNVGLCAYVSEKTYLLYQMVNALLMIWLHASSTRNQDESEEKKFQKRIEWSKHISVELYRIDQGFNHFFDFYNDTPDNYCGIKDIGNGFNGLNEIYVDTCFDEDPDEYVVEILQTLKRSPDTFYLYKLILNPDFPVSDCTYDKLIDKFDDFISETTHLSLQEREILLSYALGKYGTEFQQSNFYMSEKYRQEQSKRIYIYRNGVFECVDIVNDSDIIVENHIVVLLDKVIKALSAHAEK